MQLPESGKTAIAGKSVMGRDIELSRFGTGGLHVWLIGGVHGDESEGYLLAERFRDAVTAGDIQLEKGLSLFITPRLNPDGCAADRRTNGHNVDLNRNLPTQDWVGEFTNVRYYPGASAGSEPESKLTLEILTGIAPAMIVSLHSYEHAMINFNGPCENLAAAMSAKNGLPPKGDIGYPTPGSLGTYTGWERNIPTITLEIFRGEDPETAWANQKDALVTAFEFYLTNDLPAKKEP